MTEKIPTSAEVIEAVSALRDEVKTYKSAADPEKIEKINQTLDAFEVENQKRALAFQKSANEAIELKERVDSLEAELARAGSNSQVKHYSQTPEYKALQRVLQVGVAELSPEEKALLRTDSDNAGGYLVIDEMDTQITKGITEISPMRTIARVRRTRAKTFNMAIRKTIPQALYEGEAETGGDDASTYGAESLTTFRQTVTVPITMDMLMEPSFNMESEIFIDAQEGFAYGEGNKFVVGTGVKQPMGFLSDIRVDSSRQTTASGLIDAESIIMLSGDLKTGYNPVYTFNRTTLAAIRALQSTTGDFLWQPGLNGMVPNTLNGYPYVIMPDMPDIAAGAKSLAFGDFMRGYTIIDRTSLSIIRDEVSKKRQAIVEFTLHRWNTGQVVLPEAIKILKIKA